MKILIYYHDDPDGIMSGAIAKKYYSEQYCSEIECRKINYNYDFEKEYNYIEENNPEKLIIVDFCFPEEYMNKFKNLVDDFIWIDHHPIIDTINLEKDIEGLRNKDNAGCVLTWKYFYPNQKIPYSVDMIEDLDLWKWKLNETKPFINYFDTVCKIPDDVLSYFKLDLLYDDETIFDFIKKGEVLVQAQNKRVKKSFESGRDIIFEHHKTRSINSNHDISQIGEYCYKDKGYQIGLIWKIVGDKIIVGLRSNTINVGKIAKKYYGGGHKFASGFILPLDDINLLLKGKR